MSLNEWKELGFVLILMFYAVIGLMGIVDTIIKCKKRQAQIQKELRKLRWKEARCRCGY